MPRRRIGGAMVQAAHDAQPVAIRLERAVDVLEGEALARRVGGEAAHHPAMGDGGEPEAPRPTGRSRRTAVPGGAERTRGRGAFAGAVAANAGTIASSSGKASVAPTPFKKVR